MTYGPSYEESAAYKQMLFDMATGEDVLITHRYSELLHTLFEREFTYIIFNDDNRANDGLNIRNHYAWANDISVGFWEGILPNNCTMLEMMLALARRWNDEFLWDPDYGDRTSQWFWEMIKNLGLDFYDNYNFDRDEVNRIIDVFLDREYDSNGEHGGMFPVREHGEDMRETELWYQMNYYLEENYSF